MERSPNSNLKKERKMKLVESLNSHRDKHFMEGIMRYNVIIYTYIISLNELHRVTNIIRLYLKIPLMKYLLP